jgi:protein-S-isoprenylcysteine O-methyltransferase Ste14
MIGWGMDDIEGFFAHPQLLCYAVSIAGFGVVAACQMILLPESFHGWKGTGRLDEEALMRRKFGAEWEAYCRKSSRLIPYLW